MTTLFGRHFTRRELQAYCGNISQLGGIRALELVAGRERGVRAFEIHTGTGFQVTVLADRALDLSQASFRGRSLTYLSPMGQAHPAFYEAQGNGWLNSFPGGLMTTCGLRNVGAAGVDEKEEFGLHGRVGNLPVTELGYWGEWMGDEYWMYLRGSLTEGVIFGSALRLTRQISARLGGNSIILDDSVENIGGQPTPHMILYHCNLGFPLLSASAHLLTKSTQVTPHDEVATPGLSQYAKFCEPIAGYAEQVFYHEMSADSAGEVRVALLNPQLDQGLGLFLNYQQKNLPHFVQWKQMGHSTYALGLEPANCHVNGRAAERSAGRLQVLQPGEQRNYRLEIGVLDGREEMDAYAEAMKYIS